MLSFLAVLHSFLWTYYQEFNECTGNRDIYPVLTYQPSSYILFTNSVLQIKSHRTSAYTWVVHHGNFLQVEATSVNYCIPFRYTSISILILYLYILSLLAELRSVFGTYFQEISGCTGNGQLSCTSLPTELVRQIVCGRTIAYTWVVHFVKYKNIWYRRLNLNPWSLSTVMCVIFHSLHL